MIASTARSAGRKPGSPSGRSRIHRGKTGGGQQSVPVTQRNLQLLRQMQHHLPARLRPSGLQETQVPRRHLPLARQIELADPPPLPPFASATTQIALLPVT